MAKFKRGDYVKLLSSSEFFYQSNGSNGHIKTSEKSNYKGKPTIWYTIIWEGVNYINNYPEQDIIFVDDSHWKELCVKVDKIRLDI